MEPPSQLAFAKAILNIDRFSPEETKIVEQTLELAELYNTEVTAVAHVPPCGERLSIASRRTPDSAQIYHELERQAVEDQTVRLAEFLKPYAARTISPTPRVIVGEASKAIAEEMATEDYDIVILPPHEEDAGIKGRMFGSEEMRIMRASKCPVMSLRRTSIPERIIAAVDLQPGNEVNSNLNIKILRYAALICAKRGAEFHIVHSWRPYARSGPGVAANVVDDLFKEERRNREIELAALESKLRETLDDRVEIGSIKLHLINGQANEAIPNAVTSLSAEILVIGTRCRSGVSAFLFGNTVEAILHEVTCSVLTVPPDAS